MKKNIYINVGNTNTTFGYSLSNNIENFSFFKIKTKDLFNENFEEKIREVIFKFDEKISFFWISSVVPSVNNNLKNFFKKNKINYKFITHNNLKNIDFSEIKNPEEIGSDIIAQLSYVSFFFNEAIVISLGTACVIYYINNKKFSGALISPGISQSINLLNQKTEIGEFKILKSNNLFGKNTSEAVSLGIVNLIENKISYLMKKIGNNCPVICTGGDAKYFREKEWWFIDYLEILGMFLIDKFDN